jgi:hypothetical protein
VLWRYDAVFLLDVIEHVDHDVAFLRAGLRHLRSGRSVAFNVPASMLFFSDDGRAADHVRRYTSAGLRKLLHSCGVEVHTVEPWGMLMTPLLLARKALLRRAAGWALPRMRSIELSDKADAYPIFCGQSKLRSKRTSRLSGCISLP